MSATDTYDEMSHRTTPVTMLDSYKQRIREQLAQDANVTVFWKGRIALYSILKSLGIGPGDEVIVPGLTCVVVPNAVIYAGALPVYADVDAATYTITRETLEPLISLRTRAIIAQNSFGLSADLAPILDLAQNEGIEVIDDCTHGLGGTYQGRPNGTFTRVSFFSTQWNKPFSTGIGGFAVTRDAALGAELQEFERDATLPTYKEIVTLRLLHFARRNLVHEVSYWPLLRFYRWLSARSLVIGSSQGQELEAPQMPSGFLRGFSKFQARVGIGALSSLRKSIEFRRNVADEYDRILTELGKARPARPHYAEHAFLKYAARVRDRGQLMRLAERHRVRLGDWFNSPLHPIEGDLSPWGYQPGSCPHAEEAARELVNLPTDPDMNAGAVNRAKTFVHDHAEFFK